MAASDRRILISITELSSLRARYSIKQCGSYVLRLNIDTKWYHKIKRTPL
ncbi:MAG TPA: hypothetical protein VK566_03185 [Nitrososphaeraceae archaeon]|nr:hypothetical protein [Nitrososphaeraceae archaeon]